MFNRNMAWAQMALFQLLWYVLLLKLKFNFTLSDVVDLVLTCIVSCFFLSCKSQRLINVRSVSEDGGDIFFFFCKNNINTILLGSSPRMFLMV